MPELPDVEIYRQYIDATSLHKKISGVSVKSGKILSGISSSKLRDVLAGRKMESTQRHGKHLFIHLDAGGALTMHFGMTGDVRYYKDNGADHEQLRIDFVNGRSLAYISRRKLGKIGVVRDIENFVSEKDLGPDALSAGKREFRERLAGSRGSVKAALMNQKIMAGIGNIYSDEILFQAGLHPQTKTSALTDRDKDMLYSSMRRVLRTAVRKKARPEEFPRSFMTPRRGRDGKCPVCGGALKRSKIAGRTSYHCPSCQTGKTEG